MKVKLFTSTGDFVSEQTIPPFNTPPDVIIWGIRVFIAPNVSKPVRLAERAADEVVYVEAFAYSIPPPRPGPLPTG